MTDARRQAQRKERALKMAVDQTVHDLIADSGRAGWSRYWGVRRRYLMAVRRTARLTERERQAKEGR